MTALRVLAAGLGLACAAAASAQDGPVRILVGFAPGGTADTIARLVAERMKSSLGAPVVVENRPGATGFIAAEALKNATPDGRTLMLAPDAVSVLAPLTHAKLRYDPAKDFAPVSLAATYPFALVIGGDVPAKTLPEYVAWVRGNPGKGTYGVPGVGGQPQFLGLLLARASGIELSHVLYKGSAPMLIDLFGGQLPAGIALLADFVRHAQSGKVTVLAISGPQRAATAPAIPTFAELGFAAMTGTGWQGFHAPAKTPRPVVDRLSSAIGAALRAPEVGERLLPLGVALVGSTPDEFARHEAQETARWAPIVKASGYRAEE